MAIVTTALAPRRSVKHISGLSGRLSSERISSPWIWVAPSRLWVPGKIKDAGR